MRTRIWKSCQRMRRKKLWLECRKWTLALNEEKQSILLRRKKNSSFVGVTKNWFLASENRRIWKFLFWWIDVNVYNQTYFTVQDVCCFLICIWQCWSKYEYHCFEEMYHQHFVNILYKYVEFNSVNIHLEILILNQ